MKVVLINRGGDNKTILRFHINNLLYLSLIKKINFKITEKQKWGSFQCICYPKTNIKHISDFYLGTS